MDLDHLLLSPSGRIAPTSFWLGSLALSAAWISAGVISATLFVVIGILAGDWGVAIWPAALVIAICAAAFLYCYASLCTKRLHDLGRSGWWQAAPLVPMAIGAAAIFLRTPDWLVDAALSCVAGGIMASVGLSNLLSFAPGAPAENRYGPPDATAPRWWPRLV